MWVVRGFLPLRYLAIFCLNEFMPWINIVCELNCLLGKQGEMNRILRNLMWNQSLEWGCAWGCGAGLQKKHPCFPSSPACPLGPFPNWDTPPATKALPLLWKITVPTTGWWGKRMHVGGCTVCSIAQLHESRLCAPDGHVTHGKPSVKLCGINE